VKKQLNLFSIYSFVVFIVIIFLQNLAFGSFNYNFKNYSVNEGLPSGQIYQIIQDKTGYIWFGTDRGVVKYNGIEFTVYTTKDGLSSNVIYHLYENDDDEIWCYGNDHKLYYFDNEKFLPFRYNDSLIKFFPKNCDLQYFTASKDKAKISVMNFKGKRHYFEISKNGLIRENNKSGTFIKNTKQGITVSSNRLNNDIYYNDSLIYFFEGDDKSNLFRPEIVYPFCYATKFKSNIYVTIGDRIIKVDFKKKNKLFIKQIENVNIQNIISDRAGNVFVSHNKGVIYFEKGNLNSPTELLKDYNVSNIFIDDDNGLWVATLFNGLFQLDNIEHRYFLTENKTKNLGLFEKDEIIYLESNSRELYNLSSDSLKLLKTIHLKDKKHLFFSTKHHFFMSRLSRYVMFVNPIDNEYFKSNYHSYKSIIKDTLVLSLATNHNLTIESYEGKYVNLKSDNFIYDFALYKDIVILLTGNFVRQFKVQDILMEKENVVLKIDSLEIFHSEIPFFRSTINDIENVNDSIILFSSLEKGLCIYDLNNNTYELYSKENGLISSSIHQTYYKNSSIVAISRKGISLIKNKKIRNYSKNNSLLSNNIIDVVIKSDTLWVATYEGVSIIPIKPKKTEKLRIYLKQVLIDETNLELKKNYNLNYDSKYLDISFESISFYNARECNYRYILEGLDKSWIETKSNNVRYPNLPPGNFRFLVKKKQADETWSDEIELFSISKSSPFWTKNWFIFLSIVMTFLISFLIFGLMNWRQRKKQNEKIKVLNLKRKTLQAQINPHFIFNSLTSLQNFILKNEKQKSQKFLIQFSKLTRLALNHSSKNHILLSEEIEFLDLYMNLEKTRFSDRFSYRFSVDFPEESIEIPPLLIQPFVENSILHGFDEFESGGNILISFKKRDEQTVICTVKDNGKGREFNVLNAERKSFGIALIEERLDTLLDEKPIKIVDLKNDNKSIGTEVSVLIPYNNRI